MRIWLCFLSLLMVPAVAGEQRLMTHEDLIAMKRMGVFAPSPDGRQVVVQVQEYSYDRPNADGDLWLVDVAGKQAPRRLTTTDGLESSPAWHPDGNSIVFTARRGDGPSQVYLLNLNGGEAQQLTDLATGASAVQFSPDGQWISFLSRVYPDAGTHAENAARLHAARSRKDSARIITGFPYRTYGNQWFDGRVDHVMLMSADGGTVIDLLAATEARTDAGWSGVMEYDWAPDGSGLVFSASLDWNIQADRFDTKDLFWLPLVEGKPAAAELLVNRHTNDRNPVFSPDGRYLAWVGIWCCWGSLDDPVDGAAGDGGKVDINSLPSYQDNRLMVRDMQTGQVTVLMEKWDRPPNPPVWSEDGKSLIFSANDLGHRQVYSIGIKEALAGENPQVLTGPPGTWGSPKAAAGRVFAPRQRSTYPPELFVVAQGQEQPRQLTELNTALLDQLAMVEAEEVFWDHAGLKIQGWIVKPPHFDPARKWPLFLFPHGGPFGMHVDGYHFRWNAQLFAAQGYVVFMPNPTGSTGFGQKFAADVQGEWGGRVFDEVMSGVDHLLATYSWVDGDAMVAASASYGGYFMNWLITQTDRFKAVFSHAGIWNFVSMTGTSIIAHYMLMDASGKPPWEDLEAFNKYSPHVHAAKIKTPTYVSHGGMDGGVPDGQAMELYWSLQRLGVPSKFIYFPDEGHWVLQPANSRIWYGELLRWMQQHLPEGRVTAPPAPKRDR